MKAKPQTSLTVKTNLLSRRPVQHPTVSITESHIDDNNDNKYAITLATLRTTLTIINPKFSVEDQSILYFSLSQFQHKGGV